MRNERYVIKREERVVVRQRLGLEDVEAGGADPVVSERLVKRGLVHDWPARRVDEHSGRLQLRELAVTEEVVRIRRKRCMYGDEVASRQQRVEVYMAGAQRIRGRVRALIRVEHAHL